MEELEFTEPVKMGHLESDEEDCEGYFLQSSANSYDIKEKIKVANEELFEEFEEDTDFRDQRVTFNDAVDYEPSYSSDDGYVHSPYALGSDNEIDNSDISMFQPIQEELIEEIQELNINDYDEIPAEEEIYEEVAYEEVVYEDIVDEEIIEEVSEDISKSDDNLIELIQDSELIDETDLEVSVIRCDEESPKMPIIPKKKVKEERIAINCRLHCLEKKDLDAINKGCDDKIIPISPELSLKLKQKKCCKTQEKTKLPSYNGLKSEYGLSEKQLEKKRKRNERKQRKERETLIRIKEEKIQKEQYNEEIFCAWLKSVAQRKENNKILPSYGLKRPKSAYAVKNSNRCQLKVRPKTSPSKCYQCNTVVLHPGVTMKTFI